MTVRIAVAGLALAGVTGCGGGSSQAESAPAPNPAASPSLPAHTVLTCGHDEVPLNRLTNPQPATGIESAPKRAPYKFKRGDIDLADYWVVDDEPEHVSIIRGHPSAKGNTGAERTYDFAAWQYVADAPNATTDWMFFGGGACVLKRTFAGLNEATTTLDPDALPQPGDRTIQLLVHETACASGKQATGRIRVPVLEVTAHEVRVAIGVTRQEGAQDCPGHPPTPYTLELPEPLGDRALIDVSVYPEREIKARRGA